MALTCTVVVPTYNRAGLLARLLESLGQQDIGADRFEVIVVDDGSTDGTWQLLTGIRMSFPLRAFWQRNQGPAVARNVAINAAAGDVIVTLDDDVIAAPDLLRRHLEAQAAEGDIAAFGTMAMAKGSRLSPWAAWESAMLYKQYEAMLQGRWTPTPRQFYTANASVRRNDLLAAGLFDPSFRRAEDVELAYRLHDRGLTFRFLPDAIVYHQPNRSYASWCRMAWQYGHYDIIMWRTRGRHHILPLIGHEFAHERQRPLQVMARLLVGRKKLMSLGITAASVVALASSMVGASHLARSAYSAIFNLLYWQGACDTLGGRDAFWAGIGLRQMPAQADLHPVDGPR